MVDLRKVPSGKLLDCSDRLVRTMWTVFSRTEGVEVNRWRMVGFAIVFAKGWRSSPIHSWGWPRPLRQKTRGSDHKGCAPSAIWLPHVPDDVVWSVERRSETSSEFNFSIFLGCLLTYVEKGRESLSSWLASRLAEQPGQSCLGGELWLRRAPGL